MSTVRANNYLDSNGGNSAVFNGVVNAPNSMGFRNRIINGDMRIDQRNNGAAVTITATSATQYVLDRWYMRAESATGSRVSVQRSTLAPPGFTNSQLITSLSAYSIGASEHFATVQAVEGFNSADFAWGTSSAQAVTVSFWVRSSLTGTFGGFVLNNDANRCFLFSYTINAANTWEQKTVTIPGDTTGTWRTDNGIGMYLNFSLATGASLVGTPGSWSSTFNRSVTGQVSLVGTNGATFYITGVQLEAGSVATPFERRDYGRELMMCQRYYERVNNAIWSGNATSGTAYFNTVKWAVTKRAAPTVTVAAVSQNGFTAANTTAVSSSVDTTLMRNVAEASGSGFFFENSFQASSEL